MVDKVMIEVDPDDVRAVALLGRFLRHNWPWDANPERRAEIDKGINAIDFIVAVLPAPEWEPDEELDADEVCLGERVEPVEDYRAIKAEVLALRAERDRLVAVLEVEQTYGQSLSRALDEANFALVKYGQHAHLCRGPRAPCDCGFTVAIAGGVGDVCGVHSSAVARVEAERDRLAEQNDGLYQATLTLGAERDRLVDWLAEIAAYGGGDGGDWVECCQMAEAALRGVRRALTGDGETDG